MRFSSRVDHIGGGAVAAWDIHNAAQAAKRRGEDVIVLSVGDPDFSTPAAITDTAIAALTAGDTHYSEVSGRLNLRTSVADWHAKRWNVPLDADNVMIAAGAQNGLFTAAQCLFQPGDEVIVLDPAYLTYEASIGASGAKMVRVRLKSEEGFALDSEALAKAITPKTRAFFLANPNNPTGAVLSMEELRAIADLAVRHNLWVVSDEVYADLVFDQAFVSISSLPGMLERTVTVGSLSKSHAMTGWRIGWMIGPKDLIAHAGNIALCAIYGVPGFIQEAAVTALAESESIVYEMRTIYRRRRDTLCDIVEQAATLRVLRPASGMFALIDIRRTGMTANEFSWALFRAKGVSVLDATAFGLASEGHVRVAFTVSDEALEEAGRRIVAFAAEINSSAAVA